MRPWLRDLLLLVLAFCLGGWGWMAFGDVPAPPTAGTASGERWSVPRPIGPNLRLADHLWLESGPWGLPPPPPEPPPPPPPPPPPVPVGILASSSGLKAVFLVPGGGEVQLKRGDALPGGGRILRVDRFRIAWLDRDGKKREHELFGDPVPPSPGP